MKPALILSPLLALFLLSCERRDPKFGHPLFLKVNQTFGVPGKMRESIGERGSLGVWEFLPDRDGDMRIIITAEVYENNKRSLELEVCGIDDMGFPVIGNPRIFMKIPDHEIDHFITSSDIRPRIKLFKAAKVNRWTIIKAGTITGKRLDVEVTYPLENNETDSK